MLTELLEMLTYCRPHGSAAEKLLIDRFIAVLPGAWRDVYGNWHVTIGTSRVLWSCHTDTVHWHDGRQSVHYDPISGIVKLSKKARKRSRCLGADDTAGIWIMRQMILRDVPGHYIFHYGEESGGLGSSEIAQHGAAWLKDSFDFAIAFDRRGTQSIITEQGLGVTASDAFAWGLAEQILNHSSLLYMPDPTGLYTDTAEYAEHIAECSNLSVGYVHEHSKHEELDTRHAIALLDAISAIDQSALIKDRDPSASGWLFSRARSSGGARYTDDLDYTWHRQSASVCPDCGWYRSAVTDCRCERDRKDADKREVTALRVCMRCGNQTSSCACKQLGLLALDDPDEDDRPSGVDAPFETKPIPYLDPTYAEVQNALRDDPTNGRPRLPQGWRIVK